MGRDGSRKEDRWYYIFLPYNMAGGSINPLVPLFVTEGLGGNVAQAGIISAVSSLGGVPGNILWGNLSDSLKRRRPFIFVGFIGMAFALFLMAISTTISIYYFANFVYGFLISAIAPIATVLVIESFGKREWAQRLGDFSKISGIGWVAGLILGSVWLAIMPGFVESALPMRALFLIAGLLALISLFLAIRWIPEPGEKIDRKNIEDWILKFPMISFEKVRFLKYKIISIVRVNTIHLARHHFSTDLKKFYMITFIAFVGFLVFYAVLPIFMKSYVEISTSEVFVIFLASSVVSAISYSSAGTWVSKYGGKRMLSIALIGRTILFPSFFFVTFLPVSKTMMVLLLSTLHGIIGLCWAIISVAGNALVSDMASAEYRTESLGIYNAIQGIGSILGSVIGGIVAQVFGFLVSFGVAAIFVFTGLMMLLLILRADNTS